jgi:chlorophyll synthase
MSRSAAPAITADFPTPGVVLELLKPITWFPPMWAFGCGVVSAGTSFHGKGPVIATGVVLCGPLLCATSQAVNDWYDRHVDAINEPNRPIPSGRMPGRWGLYVAILWTLLSLACAASLGSWVFGAASLGLLLAWAYSAPPMRLKQNGWLGNAACGICYEGFAWVTGAAVMVGGTTPSGKTLLLAALYSFGAHGIMTLNDFKSIEGDRSLGIDSLPAQLGADLAGSVACLFMSIAQVLVVGLLLLWDKPLHALAVAVALGIQLVLMRRLMTKPKELAPWYQGTGVTLYVAGMLISAFAIRTLGT